MGPYSLSIVASNSYSRAQLINRSWLFRHGASRNCTSARSTESSGGKASAQFVAIRGDDIDLARLVAPVDQAFRTAPASARPDLHNISSAQRPFALHAQQLGRKIEYEVVAFVTERNKDPEPKPQRLERCRLFGQHTLLISRQHRQQRYR